MVGKDPHRPQGKTKDAENMGAIAYSKDAPYQAPSQKDIADQNESLRERGSPTRAPAEEARGGSRPGVPRRMLGEVEEE
jgi:hypothetical protein